MATNSCIVCVPLAFRRDVQWPTTEIAGHQVHLACQHELRHALESLSRLVDRTAPVLRWASNNQSPFADLTGLWVRLGEITEAQANATEYSRQQESAKFLRAYREAQPAEPSAEEMFEMRAAFGAGATVVDVLSGRRTIL
jgi:hypothetical protein